MPGQPKPEFIAVRPREEVAAGVAELTGRGAGPVAVEAAGALAVYRWALDPVGPAPVTGRVLDGAPSELDLAVEERAAIEASRDPGRPEDARARAAGAAHALGWILGFVPAGRRP
ncbi:hypothetical protein AB0D10_40245 [Kitasatospora sp. NPDC048545]|uniref:hypothetical protein n=1 Tax=unclassified Kitasatospora TaxID=2633591 RepID=UPI0033C8912B